MSADCVFCAIINRTLPAEYLFEDLDLLVISDINPKAPVHLLVIPKIHIESLATIPDSKTDLLGKLLNVARQEASKRGLDVPGYRIVINVGKDGGQVVPHLHVHILGGENLSEIE